MKPEIESYLREHGDKYTPEALRKQLIDAGHEADEVDAALAEWRAAAPVSARQFGRLTWLIHGVALLLMLGWMLFVFGEVGFALLYAGILALALLIGVAISMALGRALLRGPGLQAALIVPVVTALLIGGSCFGLTGGFSRVLP